MKKLPLAITTFADIRDKSQNYLYVDKTNIAWQLIDRGKYYFLSRPRRFGKSLFVDTLSDLFQSKKELFKGLAVYEQWDWDIEYPVINISFNTGDFRTERGIVERILDVLERTKKHLQVDSRKDNNVSSCFTELIENIHEK